MQESESAAQCQALIESLDLAAARSWSAEALLTCLRSLARADAGVRVMDASLRGDDSFAVTYRRAERGAGGGHLLGTVGDRDPEATLRLMPHLEPDEVPLDPQTYGGHFAIVGVEEPFGFDDYGQPDEDGVCWFNPPDFRQA